MLDALILQCAPDVAHSTMAAIVKVESGGHPWVINDNTVKGSTKFSSMEEAVAEAKKRIALGRSIDMGLAQINSSNLKRLNLTVDQVFDPCTNLTAGSKILIEFYTRAASKYGPGKEALFHALSGYNTGSLYKGEKYVRRIVAAATGGKNDLISRNFTQVATVSQQPTPRMSQILFFTSPQTASSPIHEAAETFEPSMNERQMFVAF